MESTNTLRMVPEQGWRSGFANLFRQASGSWWHTKKWLVQMILWLLLINGVFAINLWPKAAVTSSGVASPTASITSMEDLLKTPIANALMNFVVFAGFALPIAAAILAQDAIIGERQSGTAAWVLSKPVSRPAFILSKLAATATGILIIGVVVQGVIGYAQLSLKTGILWPVAGFLGSMGLLALSVLFYLTLVFMLGSIFKSRGPVMGISMTLIMVGQAMLVRAIPFLGSVTPWQFVMDDGRGNLPLALSLILGQPVSIVPVICTILLCVVFTAVAILRFQREEF